jgi:hypothetical protein
MGGLLGLLCNTGCSDESGDSSTMNSADVVDEHGVVTPLVCPGAKGCERSAGRELRAGVGKARITPTVETWDDADGDGVWSAGEEFDDVNGNGSWDGVWMAGFGNGRAATGAHDEQWARAVVFEQGDVSIGLVALDLIGLFHGDVVEIRKMASEADLGLDHILVATTHQHEGQDTMGLWGPSFGQSGYSPEYAAFVRERAVEALQQAIDTRREADIRLGTAEAPELLNDTRLPDVRDQSITSLQLRDAQSDEVFGTVVIWGNHPEALGSGNTLLTSDYPHFLREEMESQWPGSTAVFFSGILGGLTTTIGIVGCPDANGEETCPQGTFERAEYVGVGAARAAIDSLQGENGRDVEVDELGFRRHPFFLTTSNAGFALMFLSGLVPRSLYTPEGVAYAAEDVADLDLDDVLEGRAVIATEVDALAIGEVEIVTIPGELYAELWLAKSDGASYVEHPENGDFPDAPAQPPIQALMPAGATRVIINNANDALGYIIPKPQWDEAAPHAYSEDGQYGEGNSLGPQTAPSIVEAVEEMYQMTAR